MGNLNVDDVYNGVKFDIPWTIGDPPPLIDAVDLLTLDDRELFEYARDLQHEARILRVLVHEALAAVHRLTGLWDRARVRIDLLLHELRHARQEARDLRGQLRARTESQGAH